MKFTENEATSSIEILANDHFVGMPCTIESSKITADEFGKKIAKAGTIFPANDATAQGVLLSDVDVTESDKNGTIVIHGFVDNNKLIANGINVTAEAVAALPMVKFVGYSNS